MKKTTPPKHREIKLWHVLAVLLGFTLILLLPALLLLPEQENSEIPAPDTSPDLSAAPMIRVEFPDEVKEVSLEEFLAGVIAAEMPAAFPISALEAQAIAARTYIYIHSPLNNAEDKSRHDNAAVCCDSTHCQAWQGLEERQKKWGENAPLYEEKIRQAIINTWGQILTYEGQPVETPYFSSCGGQTESAAEAWGSDRPWLQSVKCNWDIDAPVYETEAVFTLAEVAQKLKVNTNDLKTMAVIEKTQGGRVASLQVGSKTLKGTELRQLLGLRSASFSWEIAQTEIAFLVHGYGHGVGLCQYGAGGMAKAGFECREILKHYYSGTQIIKIY